MSKTDLNTVSQVRGYIREVYRSIIYKYSGYDNTILSDKTTVTDSAGPTSIARRTETVRMSGTTPQWYYIQKMKHSNVHKPINAFTFSRKNWTFYSEEEIGESYDGYGRLVAQVSRSGLVENSPSTVNNPRLPIVAYPSAAELAASKAKLANRVLLKIKNQKVNIQQFIAERDQTLRLATDVIRNITSCVKNLKRGNFPAAFQSVGVHLSKSKKRKLSRQFVRDQSRAIANGWIGVQYGIKPLLDDVRGAAEALADLANQKPPLQRAIAKDTIRRTVSKSGTVNPSVPYRYVDTTEVLVEQKYVIYYRSSQSISSLPTSLGLTNPASIAWELTPWSFVVDWFYPIGNFVSAWDATIGTVFVDGGFTKFIKVESTRVMTYESRGTGPAKKDWDRRWGDSGYHEVSVTRDKLSSFPTPQLPAIKNPASTTHFFNALALLRQQFR